ncbi:hypothetical protein RHECNPAF_1260040 [Rhizobium etli CNPAF512]|nr:hypothetical protein RHECNPAF_1260040 [Rhizobium etli CNPAF512]
MAPAARLIGLDIIGAEDDAILFGDEGLAVRPHPVGQRIGFREVAVERIGLAGADRRADDPPDGASVVVVCGSDQHARFLQKPGAARNGALKPFRARSRSPARRRCTSSTANIVRRSREARAPPCR